MTKLLIISMMLFGIFNLDAQIKGQFIDTIKQQEKEQFGVEDLLENSDNWSIVIDSNAIKIYEAKKERKLNLSKEPDIAILDDKFKLGLQKEKKDKTGKILIKQKKQNSLKDSLKSKSTNNLDIVKKNKDSIVTGTEPDDGSKTINYDSSRTINHDDSRTINVDNNRDANRGKNIDNNRDRGRDLRRDLKRDMKRDKSRDRNRDMKRDKKRDQDKNKNNGDRIKIKIILK